MSRFQTSGLEALRCRCRCRCRCCCRCCGENNPKLPDGWDALPDDSSPSVDMGVAPDHPNGALFHRPDFRSLDSASSLHSPTPHQPESLGRWACLCGIFPCCACCCNDNYQCRRCRHRSSRRCDRVCAAISCRRAAQKHASDSERKLACSSFSSENALMRLLGGFALPLYLFDTTFESHRSAALSVWNLSMWFLTMVLTMGPESYAHNLANIGCESAVGFTPAYRPYYFHAGEKIGTWEVPSGGYFDIPGISPEADSQNGFHEVLRTPLGNVDFDFAATQLETVHEAVKTCEAACSSDDPIAVARALMMSNTRVWTSRLDFPETTDLDLSYNPYDSEAFTSGGHDEFATCGYFRSRHSVRSGSDTLKTAALLNTYIRPLLVAALNTRLNRALGWAGLAWMAALTVDVYVLTDWATHDLNFCNIRDGGTPQGFYDGNITERNATNGLDVLSQVPIHPLSWDGLTRVADDIPNTFTCNVSGAMMQKLRKMAQLNSSRFLEKNGQKYFEKNLEYWTDQLNFKDGNLGMCGNFSSASCSLDYNTAPCMSIVEPDHSATALFPTMPKEGLDRGGSDMFSGICQTCQDRGGSVVENVQSCAPQRARLYIQSGSEESKRAWALRVARFAKETNTTVEQLKAQEKAVHLENSLRGWSNDSTLEAFRKDIWHSEIVQMFEDRFSSTLVAGVSRKVPLLFYDETKWIDEQVSAHDILNWITLTTPIQVVTDVSGGTNPLGDVGAAIATVFTSIFFKPFTGTVPDFVKHRSYKELTRVGTPVELMKKSFKERAMFAGRLGHTWALIHWLRYLGLIVEICLIVYVATKFLLRRFAAKPSDVKCAPCLHRAKLFLDRSPKKRIATACSRGCLFLQSMVQSKGSGTKTVHETISPLQIDSFDTNENADELRQNLQPHHPSYAKTKDSLRRVYRIPSRVWAAVVSSFVLVAMAGALAFSFELYLTKIGHAGLNALQAIFDDPEGSAVDLVRTYIVPEVSKEIESISGEASSRWAHDIMDSTSKTVLESVAAVALPESSSTVSLNVQFPPSATNISNLTISSSAVELLRHNIGLCLARAIDLEGLLIEQVQANGNAIADEVPRFVDNILGTPSKLADELVHIREAGNNIVDAIENFSSSILANPQQCTLSARIRGNMLISACINTSIASFAALVPATPLFSTRSGVVTNTSSEFVSRENAKQLRAYALLIQHQMQSAVTRFTKETLPSLACNASAIVAGNVYSSLLATKLTLDGVLRAGVSAALESDKAQRVFDSIPGIDGRSYVEYLTTMGVTPEAKERLFGFGDELVRAMVRTQIPAPYIDPETNLPTDCTVACSPIFATTNTVFLVVFITGIVTSIFSVFAVVAVYAQIWSFLKALRFVGQRQLDIIHTHFDPQTGYKKALLHGKMTLEDVCSVIGRNPTVQEFQAFGMLGQESERKLPRVVAAFSAKLKYEQSLMQGANFLGSFVFLNVCAFWIYHILMIIVGTIVGVYPAWIALFKMPELWLPLTLSIITKKLLACCIARRMLSQAGDDDDIAGHRGIRFLHAYSVFEAVYTAISAILGWVAAAMRIVTSLGWTVISFSRVDVVLAGGSAGQLDVSYQSFLGIMAASRLHAEFDVTVLHAGERDGKNGAGEASDVAAVESSNLELVQMDVQESGVKTISRSSSRAEMRVQALRKREKSPL